MNQAKMDIRLIAIAGHIRWFAGRLLICQVEGRSRVPAQIRVVNETAVETILNREYPM